MQDNPYGATFYSQQTAAPERKHSGVGIASFVLSMLSGVSLFALLTFGGLMVLGFVIQAQGG